MFNLSEKQRKFLKYYMPPLGTWNATQAARRAGYANPGKAGPRVSHSPKVRAWIDWHSYQEHGMYWDGDKRVEAAPDMSKFAEFSGTIQNPE